MGAEMRFVKWFLCMMIVSAISLQGQDKALKASGGVAASGVDTQQVHILVGRSIVINIQSRLERVLVSNPAIVGTVTTSPTQFVVTAKAPGSSSVIIWDETGYSRILDVNSDVDVAGLRDTLQQAFPTDSLQVTADEGRIMLAGLVTSKAAFDTVTRIAASYSKDIVNSIGVVDKRHGRQIMLKVRFAEVDRAKLDSFGINILSTGAGHTPGVISTQQFGPVTLGGGNSTGSLTGTIGAPATGTTSSFNVSDLLNLFLFRPDLNLGATLKDLQQKNVLQILAEPNLLAMNGEEAKFLAGGEFPFPVIQGGAQNNNAITIQFRPFGVQLDFVAVIEDDDVIRLKVKPEVSSLDFANALTISGFVVPAISTRKAETEIELRNGQSFGIAGMLDHRTTAQLSKMPGISEVPILGRLFKSKSVNNTATELLVIVTPTIVDPVTQADAPQKLPEKPFPLLDEKKFDDSVGKKPAAKSDAPSGNKQQ